MATLERNSIYTTLKQNLNYIKSGHSTISKEQLFTVGRYIEGDHANILYAQGHMCSKVPELAAEQMLADRDKYWRQKKGKKLQGQTEKKKEVLAEHFYISFHQCDNVDVETAMQIVNKWLKRTGLDQHKALMAPHINTDELHVHISVCAYRADGKRKLSMNNSKMDTLRKQLDYICVEHGLSIVTNPRLLLDPEYKMWYESVVESDKIIVHDPRTPKQVIADRKKREKRKAHPETKEMSIEDEVKSEFADCFFRTQDAEENKKKKATRYYGDKKYRMHSKPDRYYSVHLYDQNGRKRSLLELIFMLFYVILTGATFQHQASNGRYTYDNMGEKDDQAQYLIDNIRLAREYDINNPSKIEDKLKACGDDMNSLKKENYRLQKIIDISPSAEERAEAAAKIESNNAVLKDLGRDYHNLKRLQANYEYCMAPEYSSQFYSFHYNAPEKAPVREEESEKTATQVAPEGRKLDIEDIMHSAEERSSENKKYKARERTYKKGTPER